MLCFLLCSVLCCLSSLFCVVDAYLCLENKSAVRCSFTHSYTQLQSTPSTIEGRISAYVVSVVFVCVCMLIESRARMCAVCCVHACVRVRICVVLCVCLWVCPCILSDVLWYPWLPEDDVARFRFRLSALRE